jgi:hypothetical protein
MKLADAQKTLLVVPGNYPAMLTLATCQPGKKDPSATNINVTLEVILDSGRTVRMWDLLPDIEKNPKVFFRYEQYINALALTLAPDFDLTPRTFAAELNKASNEGICFQVAVTIEESVGYAPRNAIKSLKPADMDLIQHVARAQRHDSDTDAAAQPSKLSINDQQSPASEDRQLI